jgi:hypothetical protein
MKIYYFFILLFFIQNVSSQTEKVISGKVVNDNFSMAKVDVINFTQNTLVVTNNNGEFKIKVAVGDKILIFVNEFNNYKLIITQKDIDANWLQINLSKMPIELDEVKVANKFKYKNIVSQEDIDNITVAKEASTPKVVGVYDGRTPNGVDFVRMGKGVSKFVKGLFGDDDDKKNEKVRFIDYLESNFDKDFYVKTLKLKEEDVTIFKEYCDVDLQSSVLMKEMEYLRIYEFLIAKSDAFKKMRNY